MADSPSQSSAGQSTRQLLDELDVLMQRMLAVPVQPGDAPTPAANPETPSSAPRSVELVPAPMVAPPTVGAVTMAPVEQQPVVGTPLMPIILKRPKSAAAEMPAVARVQTPTPPRSPSTAPSPAAAPQAVPNAKPAWMNPTATRSAPAPSSPGWGTSLVVGLNRSYDRTTDWLGPLGRWLRGEQGRSLVGWTGLAMLVGAIVWAAVRFLG